MNLHKNRAMARTRSPRRALAAALTASGGHRAMAALLLAAIFCAWLAAVDSLRGAKSHASILPTLPFAARLR